MRPFLLMRTAAATGLLAATLALPSTASALTGRQIAQKVFQDYSADGVIDPCKHTSDELRMVEKNISPDIEQYAPDYREAVKAALESRARGDCAGKKPSTAVVPVPTLAPVVPTPTPTPIPTAIPTKTVVPEPPQPETATVTSIATVTSPATDLELRRVATARPANTAPAPVLLLAILGGLLAAGALFLLTARRFGWGEERLAAPRHALREASWRAGGAWEDFRDWLRLGR